MYKIISNGNEDFIAIKLSGFIGKDDIAGVVPIVLQKLEKFNKTDFYLELENLDGWDQASLKELSHFDSKYTIKFNKIAIAGDHTSGPVFEALKAFLPRAEIKFFEKNKQLAAINWVVSKHAEYNEPVYKNSTLLE